MSDDSQVNPEDIGGDLEVLFGQLSRARLDNISSFNEVTSLRQALLEHEALRLDNRLGSDNPRVQRLRKQIELNRDLARSVTREQELSGISPVQVAADDALVEGRLVDEDQRGLERLVVTLEDESGRQLREVGRVETDAAGYYAVAISRELIENLPAFREQGIFLTVRTEKGELVERTPEPIRLNFGTRVNLSAAFNRAEVGAVRPQPPPRPPSQPPAQPSPEAPPTKNEPAIPAPTPPRPRSEREGATTKASSKPWVLRGQVLDEQNTPIAGALVRLYSVERSYDHKLQSATTGSDGTFTLSNTEADFRSGPDPAADLYLTVSDKKKELYRGSKAVSYKPGTTQRLKIKIQRPR